MAVLKQNKQTGKMIRIIGVPTDLGQSLRGVDMGPSALRYAGLSKRLGRQGYCVEDIGNINVPVRGSLTDENVLPAIRQACESAYKAAREAVSKGCLPVFLGGDHSISIGTIGGITHDTPAGVIWIDAHGDYNTQETSNSRNIHGMALALLVGRGIPELVNVGRQGAKVKPQDVVIIGVRDLDAGERALLKKSGITIFTMRDIDERGIKDIAHEAMMKLQHLSRIHVSLDIDSLDPAEAPGVGTPAPGGLTYREAHLLMEIIADSGLLAAMDIVEINPIIDKHNQTAIIAADLAVSLFGKSII